MKAALKRANEKRRAQLAAAAKAQWDEMTMISMRGETHDWAHCPHTRACRARGSHVVACRCRVASRAARRLKREPR